MSRKKLIVISLSFLPLLVLDIGSKLWAEAEMATPRHPLAFEVSGDAAGLTVQALLSPVLGPKEDWHEFSRRHVFVMDPADLLTADGPAFPETLPTRALFAFSRGEGREDSPRGIWLSDFQEAREAAITSSPGASPAAIQTTVVNSLKDINYSDILAREIPYVEKEEAARLLEDKRVLKMGFGKRTATAETTLKEGQIVLVMVHTKELIDGFLRFTYAENPGAAWGFLGTAPPSFRHVFFTGISILAFVGMWWMTRRLTDQHTLYMVAFGMLLSGAVGNFIDRSRFRYVIDFIDMYVGDSHWPTYNVADIAISIGFGLILVDMLFLTKGAGVFDDKPAPEPQSADE